MQAMRADIARELGAHGQHDERLPIAVNADSLATWVLPALQPVVQAGLAEGFGLELIVDDQDFTHESLREGTVLGCVSTVAEALRGCSATPLGSMRYVAVASPGFIAQALPPAPDFEQLALAPPPAAAADGDKGALQGQSPLDYARARLRGAGVRLRAVLGDDGVLVLPAFGEFTGGALVRAASGDAVYLVAHMRVAPHPHHRRVS
jgi:LysR family transcriptional regulator (chromosome initiation inhibitor)